MNTVASWILRLTPAILIGQTLPFKFLGKDESKQLFSTLAEKALNAQDPAATEAFLRISTGGVELLAIILLLIPKWSKFGAILVALTMIGALVSHALFLGFEGSHGQLGIMAVISLVCSLVYFFMDRKSAS